MFTNTVAMTRVGISFALAATALVAEPRAQQKPPAPPPAEKLEISAFGVNMGTVATGGANVVDINITGWSTPEERTRLIEAMLSKGQDALLSQLQRAKVVGRIRLPNWRGPDPQNFLTGHNLRYAWSTPAQGGGRRIVAMTDRPMSFAEMRADPRTTDYPFTVIELRVDANGNGTGAIAAATKVIYDKAANNITLENFGSEPVRLEKVTVKVVK